MKNISRYVVIVTLVLFCLFSYFYVFDKVENGLQDSLLQKKSTVDSRIIILGIDDLSLEKLGQWPWPRNYMADVINKLSQGKAAAIGIDSIYSEETRDSKEDASLVKAVKDAGNVVMPVYGNFGYNYIEKGKMEPINLEEPFPKLKEVASLGHINAFPDSDNVVRETLTSFDYKGKKVNSFAIELYNQYLKKTSDNKSPISVPTDGWNRSFITYTTASNDENNFENFSIYKVLSGEVPPEYFQDKIVLIGPYTVGFKDSYITPLNRTAPMYGVEIHANILQNLLNRNFKQSVPDSLSVIVLIFLGACGYFLFKKLKPVKSAMAVSIFIIIYIIGCKLAFSKGYIVQIFYPIALVLIIYIVMLASHYIVEYLEKKRIKNLFGKYVAPQVVSKILDGGEESIKLGGVRRMISVLFVDIRGFTPLSEKCQPEEVVDILNQYLDLTSKSILDNLGMLDKFIGDATMALFNAPFDLEDHEFRAVKAAWEMKQGADALQRELLERFGRTVQFGIGVNTGYAVVGNIGSKIRMDYTAIGDTVNTAARLESNAKPGQVLLSEAIYERVRDRVSVTPLGEIKVKGKEQGVIVYQLEGIR